MTTKLKEDAISIRQRTCQECHMLLEDAGEYHPYAFCVLKKAGLHPWQTVRLMAAQLGLGPTSERPPRISQIHGPWED